jgi:hypothetical protein
LKLVKAGAYLQRLEKSLEKNMGEKNQDLQELFYNFTVLYERWNEDKLALSKQTIKLEQLMKDFTMRINEFEEIKEGTKDDVVRSVFAAANKVSKEVVDQTRKVVEGDIIRGVNDLQKMIKTGEEIIEDYKRCSAEMGSWSAMSVWFVAIVTAVFVGIFTVRLVIPRPILPLSERDMMIYMNGKNFEILWSKLSKEEKEKLDAIVNNRFVSKPKLNVKARGSKEEV